MKSKKQTYPEGYNIPLYMPTTSSISQPTSSSGGVRRGDFGDPRRLSSFRWLSDLIHKEQSCSINAIVTSETQRKRAERFLNNSFCPVSEVIDHCCVSIGSPALADKCIYNILDQTVIGFASAVGRMKDQERQMGRVGNGFQYGQNCVAGLFAEAGSRKILGLSSLSFHSTAVEATPGRDRIGRDERPLRYRESYKWKLGVKQARLRAAGATKLIHVIDREADNLNFLLDTFTFSTIGEQGAEEHFVIRAKENRVVLVKDEEEVTEGKILSHMENSPVALCTYVKVSADERMSFSADYKKGADGRRIKRVVKRKGRTARLTIRVVRCCLSPEQILRSKSDMPRSEVEALVNNSHLSQRQLSYIQIREVDVQGKIIPRPADKKNKAEQPINWLLLTTMDTTTPAQLLNIIDIYRLRFPLIEQLFRGGKSDGIDIESAQHQSVEVLQKVSAMAMKSSALVMKMIGARDVDEGFPIEEDFTEQECEVLLLLEAKYSGTTTVQSNGHPPDQLSWAVWIIARMGGWKPENKQRPPGPKTLQRGLDKFYSVYEGIALLKKWE